MNAVPFSIRFLPDGRVYEAVAPTSLVMAAAAAGILLEQPCGGEGTCGACRVRVVEGLSPESAADRDQLTADERADGWRLACHLTCHANMTVEVPLVSRAVAGKSFGASLPPEALERPVVRIFTTYLATDSGLNSRLEQVSASAGLGTGALEASPAALDELSEAVAIGGGQVSAVVEGRELVTVRAGWLLRRYGLAVDIGTTSLAVALVNLADGEVVSECAALNPQAAFGADVIARIKFASEAEDGARRLAAVVRDGIRTLATDLFQAAFCTGEDVVAAAIAGNPTMMQAWAGVDLASLGTAPYEGAWSGTLQVRAREVELPIHDNAGVFGFPPVRSHVGGDLVAAAVAVGFDQAGGRRLLIDLGTNSEILVADGDRYVAASGAAGPAFEGVSIHHGMRAAPGAINLAEIEEDGELALGTVAGVTPIGICGSGLIDLVAELRRVGIIDPTGYLRARAELPPGLPARLARRLEDREGQRVFRLADGSRPLLTARDIREVQLAKGSIRAAVTLACRALGFEPEQMDEVLLAGAFGNYIRKASAIRLGLVPAIDPLRVRFIGNAAGIGARLALVDQGVRSRAATLALEAHYLDLAGHPEYQPTFMASLALDATAPRHSTS